MSNFEDIIPSRSKQLQSQQGHREADSESKSEWTLSKAGQFSVFRSSLTLPINPPERQVSSDGEEQVSEAPAQVVQSQGWADS